MTNSKYSSEGGSDRETNEDEDDFAFEYLEADTSESFKVEAFIRESCGCQARKAVQLHYTERRVC